MVPTGGPARMSPSTRPNPTCGFQCAPYRTDRHLLQAKNRNEPNVCYFDRWVWLAWVQGRILHSEQLPAKDSRDTGKMGVFMRHVLKAVAVVAALCVPGAAFAQAVTLQPANPQPSAGSLKNGLAVTYANLPSNVRSLAPAKSALKRAGEPGKPIAGLVYDDTSEGDPVMTSGKAFMVGAAISGYIKFDKAGTYVLDFLNNDGLELFIGGQKVALYDGIHGCGYAGEIEVNVPKAGYYPLQATYFQRKGTACLLMEYGTNVDNMDYAKPGIFFH